MPTNPVATMARKTKAVAPGKSRLAFKAKMLAVREEAIVQAVNRLLAEKGFDLMTVDQVAAEVGIAKASLYKHFPSKEDLAAAAMTRVLQQAETFLAVLPPDAKAVDRLKALVRWMVRLHLAGKMPSLPHQNSSLRTALMNHKAYLNALMRVSDQVGGWIESAQKDGALSPDIPALVVLYTLYARACDPVVEFLKEGGQHSHGEIVELVLNTCFDGLNGRKGVRSD